ncbi:MAG: glycosyltransferase family 4 protein [Candidatus Andersenbacteria bacterium]|nr:glycosyltransferase family 4 protein [Candidatus Andersenbacteria bacterium]MBI3250266.1 glycosyltransferase family 4 protein [Candidatus Andersenbacteria bacterium]
MNILFLSGQYPPHSKGGGEISTSLIADGLRNRGVSVEVVTDTDLPGLIAKPLFERSHAQKLARILAAQKKGGAETIGHAHDFRSGLVLYELMQMGVIEPKQAYITLRDYAAISGDTNNIVKPGSITKEPLSMHASWKSYRVQEAPFPRNIARFWQYTYNIRYRNKALSSIPNRIYISNAQRQYIEQHLPVPQQKTRITTIYNPVAPEYFQSPAPTKNTFEVLYVGRIEEYKGVRLLLTAWREVVVQVPQARLKLVGRGAQETEYVDLVREWGLEKSVTFVEHVPYEQMIKLYDAAGIIVSPHLWAEPFGRSVIEAMARARVVIAANHGGPAELIQPEKTGILFSKGSVGALSTSLVSALHMPIERRQAIGAAARQWTEQHLSVDHIARQYKQFYRETSI